MLNPLRLFLAIAIALGLALAACSSNESPAAAPADAADVPDAVTPTTPDASDASSDDVVIVRPNLRVLFVGNSYTYVHDVPGMLTRIASTAGVGPTIETEQVVHGGWLLQQHWNDGIAQERIAKGGFSHVVIQGQSSEPTGSDNSPFLSPAKLLGDFATNAGARPTWFVTWARAKEGLQPALGEMAAVRMQDELTFGYGQAMRSVPGSLLACVGEAWRVIVRDHPGIALHDADHSHATIAGAYLAAATFYVALTGTPVPPASVVPDGISAEAASVLRDAARVGSNCADVIVRGDIFLDAEPWWWDRAGNTTTEDFGTAASNVKRHFYLRNTGRSVVGISDAMTLAPPFAWSSGAYPGGAGVDPILGRAYCSSMLAPGASCALSVTYSGASTNAGTMTLDLATAYQAHVTHALKGTRTNRGSLVIRRAGPWSTVQARIGQSMQLRLLVSNVGASTASSVAPDLAPSDSFAWDGDGTFPGGAGAVQIGDVTYEHCAGVLPAGATCVMTLRFAPQRTGAHTTKLGIEWWSAASGDVAVRDVALAQANGWGQAAAP